MKVDLSIEIFDCNQIVPESWCTTDRVSLKLATLPVDRAAITIILQVTYTNYYVSINNSFITYNNLIETIKFTEGLAYPVKIYKYSPIPCPFCWSGYPNFVNLDWYPYNYSVSKQVQLYMNIYSIIINNAMSWNIPPSKKNQHVVHNVCWKIN